MAKTDKIRKYLNEARVSKDLTAHVTNKVQEGIDEYQDAHYGLTRPWETRDEDLERLADEMMDFFGGMKRAAKQGKRKRS